MKNYGYIRRSSKETKVSYSIDSQKRIIRELAARDDVMIQDDDFIIDNGYSGEIIRRPGIQKLLRLLATTEKGSTVYIWMSSRISRNPIFTHSLRCVFDKYDVTLKSYNNDWASLKEMRNSPDRSLFPNIIGAADAAEIARDRNRTLVGLKTSSQVGRNYTKGGTMPPTGWRFIKNVDGKGRKVELDLNYVPTVLYICTQIHDAKRTIDSLASELDSKRTCGVRWSYSKIYKLVTNKLLYGCLETSWVTVEDHSPCYIDKAYFDEMQEVLHGRKKEHRYQYLFKNKIECYSCNTLCSEIPTVHYPRYLKNKTERRKNVSTVYKYYYCPKCKLRINESKLSSIMTIHINEIIENGNENGDILKQLKDRLLRIRKKIEFLDNEYEEDFIDEEYYKKEYKTNLKKMKDMNELIKHIEYQLSETVKHYSYKELKHIIESNFIKIVVNMENKDISSVIKNKQK